MNQSSPNEEQIFRIARVIPSSIERSDYLKQVCGDNSQLFERMVALLKTTDEENSFLESPPEALDATRDVSPSIIEKPGAEIGPYKLLQQIGEGGFGVVYMAEQLRPVKRKVALKIIKPGMDSKEVIARFEAERQALALMDHPNIAKVFDGGTTDSGRPYFVMELVKGVALTEFCDKNLLTTKQRLKLFTKVCQAIQHAHQKGVIHRDIKPSNVMVTLNDNQPIPKVIDFGVAKAISQELTEKTLFTTYGQMIGTPQYMSPEQAQMSGLDIDTRSDVYSLGVLLYELLTGKTPLDIKQLRNTAYAELQRLICEVEPSKPSTKVSSLGEASMTIAQNRGIDARKLNLLLRGDLDWIVMTALDKDRNRRYESAGNFAADIERYLTDEPIQARPPSTTYKFQKFIRRNRGKVYGWTGAALLLVVASVSIFHLLNTRADYERVQNALLFEKQDGAIDDALAAIRSMNSSEYETTVSQAQSLINSQSAVAHRVWLEIFKGRLAMDQDNSKDAMAHFEKAIELDPNGVVPRANLALAYGLGSRLPEMYRRIQRLDEYECITADDHLFKGELLAYGDHWHMEKAEKELTEAISKKTSCYAYFLRARVRKDIAMASENTELFVDALRDLENALEYTNDRTIFLDSKFSIFVNSAFCFRALGDEKEANAQYLLAKQMIEEEEIPESWKLGFHWFNKDDEKANADAYSELEMRAHRGGSFAYTYALETIARGEPEKGEKRMQEVLGDKKTMIADCSWGYVHAMNGDNERAKEHLSRLMSDEISPELTLFLTMPLALLLGDTEFATANCKRLENEIELGASASLCLKLFTGQLDENSDLFLNEDKRDQHAKLMGLQTLAFKRLAEGDRKAAKGFFLKILKIQNWWDSIPYFQARAILYKLENEPDWPKWIPQKNFE